MKNLKIAGLLGGAFLLLLSGALAAPAPEKANIEFGMDTGNWEPGETYELSLILRNNGPDPLRIAGLQADFNYDPTVFTEAPVLVTDYITGYDFLISDANTQTPGMVYYIKGIKMAGQPNYFSLAGAAVQPLAVFRFRVNEEAPPGESEFRFRVTVAVVQRRENGETVEIMGEARVGRFSVIPQQN